MDLQGKTAHPALKICGVTRVEDVRACLELGVDFVGFNLYSGSKRYVPPADAARLWAEGARGHAGRGRPAAVLVDPTPELLAEAFAVFPALEVCQFHGRETAGTLASFAALLGPRKVWKAIGVHNQSDIAAATVFAGHAHLVLFDSAAVPVGAKVAGGSGQAFDWTLLAAYRGPLPFGIAGGLKPGQLASLRAYAPAVIDVCSGVETAPGIKDAACIAALIQELHVS